MIPLWCGQHPKLFGSGYGQGKLVGETLHSVEGTGPVRQIRRGRSSLLSWLLKLLMNAHWMWIGMSSASPRNGPAYSRGMSQSAQEDLCGTSASADLALCSLPV